MYNICYTKSWNNVKQLNKYWFLFLSSNVGEQWVDMDQLYDATSNKFLLMSNDLGPKVGF